MTKVLISCAIQVIAIALFPVFLYEGHHRHMDEYQKRYDVMKYERTRLPLVGTVRERRFLREKEEYDKTEARYAKFDATYKQLS